MSLIVRLETAGCAARSEGFSTFNRWGDGYLRIIRLDDHGDQVVNSVGSSLVMNMPDHLWLKFGGDHLSPWQGSGKAEAEVA